MAYVARTIKDRVAVGDDCYRMTTLPDGRVRLTPSPDSVSEPGTDINKGLLQVYENTLAQLYGDMELVKPRDIPIVSATINSVVAYRSYITEPGLYVCVFKSTNTAGEESTSLISVRDMNVVSWGSQSRMRFWNGGQAYTDTAWAVYNTTEKCLELYSHNLGMMMTLCKQLAKY